MLWHIVKLRFAPGTAEADRSELETSIRGLVDRIDDLRLVRVARSIDEPDVTGLVTGFDDEAGLERYRVHPDHIPVLDRVKTLCVEIVRLDMITNDPVDALNPT